ncbi:shikimate dehydrogenase [Vicingaceae bacterium]|nr:shikimate dehydrogenase [Vicingaceae bacterium]
MKNYGLLGKHLSHSFSEKFFSEKFFREEINETTYQKFEIDSIIDFKNLLQSNPKLSGLNVTIPYKESILPYLDEVDTVAEEIGAVNTIQFKKNGNLKGFNTDVIGFRNSIKPFLDPNHSRALIFGTGGASKAIAYVLTSIGIPFYFVSRNPSSEKEISYEDLDKTSIESFRFLINCTPLGTYPNTNVIIPIETSAIGKRHLVYDLVYNPKESRLLKVAESQGAITVNGLSMFKIQAEESWKIWNS